MDRLRSPLHLIVTLALMALVTLACNSGGEEPSSAQTATPDSSGGMDRPSLPLTDLPPAPGEIAPERILTDLPEGVVAEIPDGFPSDLPVYPGSQPAQGRGGESESGMMMSGVQFVTGDSAQQVLDFYMDDLEAKGWDIQDVSEHGRNRSISAESAGRKASVWISTSPDGGADIFIITEG